jgi:HEAT repeat protein/MFS family permease
MPAPTSRLENLRSLRSANLDGSFATAFVALTSGTFLVGFVKMLGGSDLWIGLLSGLPNIVGILQIPGGVVGRQFPSYKRFVMAGGFTWRLLLGLLIPLPLLPIEPQLKLTLLAVILGIGWACNTFVSPVYNEWLGEMVPSTSRGFFFSRRNATMAATGALVGIVGGLVMDGLRAQNLEARGYSIVFAVGFVCAVVSMVFFMRMHDYQRPVVQARQSVGEAFRDLRSPFLDPTFRKVLIFIAVFVCGQMFAGNLFAAFAIEALKLPFTVLQIAALTHAAGNVFLAPAWGFISDKYGNKPALLLAAAGVTLTPLPWMLCVPGEDFRNAVIIAVLHIFSGASWAGVTLCQFNLVLATAKPEQKSTYIGAALALQAIAGGLSPLLGAAVMEVLRPMMNLTAAYGWVFGLTSIFRLIGSLFLIPVREEGAIEIRRALRDLTRVTPSGYMAMRSLVKSADENTRATAIEHLASRQMTMATDEMIKALHDPSPRIRRQAAMGLARIGERGAAEALLHQVEHHPDLVEEELVDALGQLGGASAVDSLIQLLESPRSSLRRAAARALGRIGTAEGVEALARAGGSPADPDLRRVALQSLRILGARDAEGVFRAGLSDAAPSVRTAAAEGVAELELRSAIPDLRKALVEFHDEASAEVAYALGVVGSFGDLPLILIEAQRSESMITRRRCLLGAARMLGVERVAYQLLLMDGMARDSSLIQLLTPHMKRNPRLRAALERYSTGEEAEALAALKSASKDPVFATFLEHPVEESFLIAACAFVQGK